MTAVPILSGFDRVRWMRLADWLAAGVALSLPWSTSATGILIALWLLVILPTLDAGMLRREFASAAGGLPILLWVLAAIGLLWADAAWSDRLAGFDKFHRLLVIPLLLAQYRRSERGIWVVYAFFASVFCLLLASWASVFVPGLSLHGDPGVPVKDYIMQSATFLICAFALLGRAFQDARAQHWRQALGLVVLAFLFLANIVFVVTSRTALLVAPALILLLGWREFGWRGLFGAGLLGSLLGVALWFGSPYLRERLITSVKEWQDYRVSDAMNSTGLHLEFLKKSLSFVEAAPIIGHGTGSIAQQFRNAATVGETAASSVAPRNPHNQIFAVAIQLGIVGAIVLLAMWASHLLLFCSGGFTAWIGIIIVVQNVISSLFNSHLFDFGQGWLYVFGVGVAGGRMLRERDRAPAPHMAEP